MREFEKLLEEFGFEKKLSILEELHFKRRYGNSIYAVWKQQVEKYYIYFLFRVISNGKLEIKVLVREPGFLKYRHLEYIKSLGDFGQDPFVYGKGDVIITLAKLVNIIDFVKMYSKDPELTMEFEMTARSNNAEHIILYLGEGN